MNWDAFFGKLASDVAHIHTIVSDLRTDLRDTNRRLDRVHYRLDGIADKTTAATDELAKHIDAIRAELVKRQSEARS
jgi:hypothetical protein